MSPHVVIHRKLAKVLSPLRVVRGRVAAHPYPIVVAAWMSLVYAERLAVHQYVFGLSSSLWTSFASTSVVLCFLLGWGAMLAALLVDRVSVGPRLASLLRAWRQVLRSVLSPVALASLVLGLLLVAFARGAYTNQTIDVTLDSWVHEVAHECFARIISPGTELLLFLSAVSAIWFIVHRFLANRTQTVEEAIHELVVGAGFISLFVIPYVWLHLATVLSKMSPDARAEAVGGLLKDVAVYSIVALGLVVGTSKAGRTLRRLDSDILRWIVWTLMAVVTIACAIVALVLDFHYKDRNLLQGLSPEYPKPW